MKIIIGAPILFLFIMTAFFLRAIGFNPVKTVEVAFADHRRRMTPRSPFLDRLSACLNN